MFMRVVLGICIGTCTKQDKPFNFQIDPKISPWNNQLINLVQKNSPIVYINNTYGHKHTAF